MKRLLPLLYLFFALAAPAQLARTLPAPTGYIDDYAHVLSPAGSAAITALCTQIHDQTRAQVFLVTVPTLAGDSIEQFSNDLFHQWKIGEKGTDRGILIVFATGERTHRIEVGYGFEGVLNDARAGDIGRNITPALHARHYDQAALEAVTQLAAVITPEVAPEPAPEANPSAGFAPVTDPDHSNWGTLVIFLLVGFTFFAAWAFVLARRRNRPARQGTLYGSDVRGYSDSGAITTGSLFSSGSDSSSSDSPSDSSSDSSSSGDSFSGGDGGDSGGGGASGSDGGDSGGGDSGGGDGGGGDGGGGGE